MSEQSILPDCSEPIGYRPSVDVGAFSGYADYRFEVESQAPDGSEVSPTIYVVVSQGGKPEFTQVVR